MVVTRSLLPAEWRLRAEYLLTSLNRSWSGVETEEVAMACCPSLIKFEHGQLCTMQQAKCALSLYKSRYKTQFTFWPCAGETPFIAARLLLRTTFKQVFHVL